MAADGRAFGEILTVARREKAFNEAVNNEERCCVARKPCLINVKNHDQFKCIPISSSGHDVFKLLSI